MKKLSKRYIIINKINSESLIAILLIKYHWNDQFIFIWSRWSGYIRYKSLFYREDFEFQKKWSFNNNW